MVDILEKECKKCGGFLFGRLDRKFCSDRCRNNYNNALNSDRTNIIRNINNSLRKNHRILSELNPNGKVKVDRRELKHRGFEFDLFTSIYRTKSGKEYRYCYDQGYLELENYILLVNLI